MMMRARILAAVVTAGLGLALAAPASAAEGHIELPKQNWSFGGPFGTFDQAQLKRGYQIYGQVCSACHSMRLLYYRNLMDIGMSESQVKEIAAGVEVTDGPNDEGEMFTRPGRPSDHFRSPFPNDNAARAANGGALPPDLSLITKAREGGANYVYGVLTGFTDPPAGVTVPDGMHYNKVFPGHMIAMAPPLSEGLVDYGGEPKATVDQMAQDVTTFLAWASEPEMEARKRLGIKVMLFLIIFTGMLYAVKRKVWSNVH
jgi:ubiquinol-cytochrome c reductase cytochrome c1 subunit